MKMLVSLCVPSGTTPPQSSSLQDMLGAALSAASSGKVTSLVVVWHPSETVGEAARNAAADVLEACLTQGSVTH